MSNIARMMQRATAGAAGGAGIDVDEVFSTYLYDGNSSAQTITNGIDLSGEGGLVWTKRRDDTGNGHHFVDTARGGSSFIRSNSTQGANTGYTLINSFNSNGYTLGPIAWVNGSGGSYVSWTFRQAPKFFDVGTISFNSSGVGSYSHNLGVTPAMVIFKLTNTTGDWFVWHKDLTSQNYAMFLNATSASSNQGGWATYTDTTVSFNSSIFANDTAVVYLFAHNNNDGEFGPDSDQDIIKCGSYTGNGSYSNGPVIDLGFEPQWVLIKNTSTGGYNWQLGDTMRGASTEGAQYLSANTSNQEAAFSGGYTAFIPTATGFTMTVDDSNYNRNGDTYIYMAIRRGPLAAPDDATKVFAMDTYDTTTGDPTAYDTTFTVDMVIQALNKNTTNNKRVSSRLTGARYVSTNTDSAESGASSYTFDTQTGFRVDSGTDANDFAWMWRRAPSYFDVVCYTGNQTSGRTVSHNLGAVPEMMWVKRRNAAADWKVYHSALGNTKHLNLNETIAAATDSSIWNDTTPTASVFTLGYDIKVNGNGDNHIAMLFASVAGVSQLGSFTATGSDVDVDCGFSSGARFVLIKGTNAATPWYLWDSQRGINVGNDARLQLESTNAEWTGSDNIAPLASGFTMKSGILGSSGNNYIFYAIA